MEKKLTETELRKEMKLHGYLMGVAWHRDDVIGRVEDNRGEDYTPKDIDDIVEAMESYFDASLGINWDVIDEYIWTHFNK